METLDLAGPTMFDMFSTYDSDEMRESVRGHAMWYSGSEGNNKFILINCIRGDGIGTPSPVQLRNLEYTKNMDNYKQSVPAFTYNAAVFPPYGDTKHHWSIYKIFPFQQHISFITDSKEEILDYICRCFL